LTVKPLHAGESRRLRRRLHSACSGGMKAGVPSRTPVPVAPPLSAPLAAALRARAMPKSSTFTTPSFCPRAGSSCVRRSRMLSSGWSIFTASLVAVGGLVDDAHAADAEDASSPYLPRSVPPSLALVLDGSSSPDPLIRDPSRSAEPERQIKSITHGPEREVNGFPRDLYWEAGNRAIRWRARGRSGAGVQADGDATE
jgi:hypothetical protein